MKASTLLFISIILFCSTLKAQDWGRYWCFGDSAGIDFTDLSIPAPVTSFMDCPYSCTSIGDTNGLLMYAHTAYWPLWIVGSNRTTVVHNRYHSLMQNGDSLVSNGFHNGLTFINKPGNDSLFYLFQWGFGPDAGFYYSLIDPYYNNDSGIVILKNVKLQLSDSLLQYGVHTVRHGNGRDWWIFTRNGSNSNRFNLFYVGVDSIVGPMEQNVGTITSSNGTTLSISKQGDKICIVSPPTTVEVYSFDRCTGSISNPLTINVNAPSTSGRIYMAEFSPNGQLLYVATTNNIFGDSLRLEQINLLSPNPSNSIEIIYKENVPASGGNLRRGPDDKIYLTCLHEEGWPYSDTCRNQYNENLSVINYPDSVGLACNFTPFSFYLGGKRAYWNLPNNANYLLGPLSGSACDSLTTFIQENKNEIDFKIYPNPCSDKINISSSLTKEFKIQIINSNSKVVFSSKHFVFSSIDVKDLNPGIYFLRIDNYTKKIVVIR